MKQKSVPVLIGIGVIGVAVFLIVLIVYASTPFGIKDIIFENLPDNRLRFKVSVTTSRKCDAVILYWKDNENDTLRTMVSNDQSRHILWIVNTKAESHYKFIVKARAEGKAVYSKVYSFSTKVIYQATPYFTLDHIQQEIEEEQGQMFFLTQKLSQPGSAIIIDRYGDIVWYQAFEKGTKVTNWTPHRTVLCILGADSIPFSGGDEIVEINLSGETVRRLRYGDGTMDKLVHHEVRYDNAGNIYALTFDKRVYDLRKFGGNEMDTVLGDGIVMFDRQNRKIWEWSVFDHLDPLSDSTIARDKKDWVHANSLFRDVHGNFIISFRDLNQVWKVDYRTGSVIWKLGKNGDFNLPEKDLFTGQHAAYSDSIDRIILLDNGIERKLSRVLAFTIDPHSKYVHASLNIELDEEYFSIPKGNAYLLDNNRVLVCASDPRALLIVDKRGKILWKVSIGGYPYRVEMINNLIVNGTI